MSCSSQYHVPPRLDPFDINVEGQYSASLGAMGSLLSKLDDVVCIDSSACRLRDDLNSISTELAKLSQVDEPSLTMNYWMKDVRELSYDMEDCVDQFPHTEDADAKISWINNLLEFEAHVEEVRERYDRYKLEFGMGDPIITISHCYGRVYGEPRPVVPVGLETPTNEVRRLLEPKSSDENDLQLKIVAVLGVQGVGKSTLAQKLWRELGGQFECHAFVQTAKKPDMRMILRSIFSQIHLKQPPEAYQVPNLIHDIRKHLQDKRYFIIIDGLWAVPVWDILSRSFPEGNHCSRIITTTAIEDVAMACCSYDPEHVFRMKSFGAEHSNQLFISIVFGSGKRCPQQLYDKADDIIKKCCGLPLAIMCIASLIASQPERKEQWGFVRNFLCHKLRTNSSSAEVLKQVLKLCYKSLPRCLKTCLLYLSIYPENYLFLKDDLVRQWIAERFLSTTEGKEIVEVASRCFDELLHLGLIQWRETDCNKRGLLSYVLHPTVFDFIKCKSMEDNFVTTMDYSQSIVVLTNKIRRLSLHFGSATYATPPTSIVGLLQIRSLTFMGLFNCMPSLVEFRFVRVMILHIRSDDGDVTIPLTRIDNLLLLRYLLVSCNVTVELPVQVQCLKHIETMEINAEVAAVPSDIVHHLCLQHVRIGRKTKYKSLAQGPITSTESVSPFTLTGKHLPAVQVLELLPPICIFSMVPWWIRELTGLRILEVVVRELCEYDLDHLGMLPVLTVLSLHVQKPSTEMRTIHSSESFPALEYFKLVSGVLLLTFNEKAMPKLRRLKICFNARGGGQYSDMLHGIDHLKNLQKVVARIGRANTAQESDRKEAVLAYVQAISNHPGDLRGNVKWLDKVDEEYDPPESSKNGGKVSEETQNEISIEDDIQGNPPAKDIVHTPLSWIRYWAKPNKNRAGRGLSALFSAAQKVRRRQSRRGVKNGRSERRFG